MRAKLIVGIVAALALVSLSLPDALAAPTTPVKIRLAPKGLSLKSKSTSNIVRLRVRRGVAWNATAADPWVQVNPPSGVGATWLTITTDANTVVVGDMTPRRETIITFTGGGATTYFPVVQNAETTSLDILTSWSPAWNGDTMTFPYTTWGTGIGFDCSTPVVDDPINRPWVTLVGSTFDPTNGRGTITLNAAPNDGLARVANVTVTCAHKSKVLKVTQGGAPTLSLSLAAWNPRKRGGRVTVRAITSVYTTWKAEVVTGADWLTVIPRAQRSATIKAASNPGGTRVGTIRFTNGYIDQTLTVTQAG